MGEIWNGSGWETVDDGTDALDNTGAPANVYYTQGNQYNYTPEQSQDNTYYTQPQQQQTDWNSVWSGVGNVFNAASQATQPVQDPNAYWNNYFSGGFAQNSYGFGSTQPQQDGSVSDFYSQESQTQPNVSDSGWNHTPDPSQYAYSGPYAPDYMPSTPEYSPPSKESQKAQEQFNQSFYGQPPDNGSSGYFGYGGDWENAGSVSDFYSTESNAKQQNVYDIAGKAMGAGDSGLPIVGNVFDTIGNNLKGWNSQANPRSFDYLQEQVKQQQEAPAKAASMIPFLAAAPFGVAAQAVNLGFMAAGPAVEGAKQMGVPLAGAVQQAYTNVGEPLLQGTWESVVYDASQGKLPGSTLGTTLFDMLFNKEKYQSDQANRIAGSAQARHDQLLKAGYTEEQAQAAAVQYAQELTQNPLKAAEAPASNWMEQQNPLVQLGLNWFNPIMNKTLGYAMGGKVAPERQYKSFLAEGEGDTQARPVVDMFKQQYPRESAPRQDPLGMVAQKLDSVQKYIAPGSWVTNTFKAMSQSPVMQAVMEPFRSPQQLTHAQDMMANSIIPKLEQYAQNTGQEFNTVIDTFIDSPMFREHLGLGVDQPPNVYKAGEEIANSLQAIRAQARYDQFKLGDTTQYKVTTTPAGSRVINGWELSPEGERIADSLEATAVPREEADLLAVIADSAAKSLEAKTGMPAQEFLKTLDFEQGDANNPSPDALYQMANIHSKGYLGLNVDHATGEVLDKTVKNEDVARALEQDSERAFGPKLDPYDVMRNPQNYVEEIVRRAKQDFDYWLRLPEEVNGVKWYGRDVAIMERNAKLTFPELQDPDVMTLFKAVLAVTSNGEKPSRNYDAAANIWEIYRQTRQMPLTQPVEWGLNEFNGRPKGWIGRGTEAYDSLRRIQALIHTYGEKGAADWLRASHPIEELSRWSNTVSNALDVGQTEAKGWSILGPKLGSFANNLAGDFSTLTADMWWSRTYNRWLGHILDKDGKVIGSPRDENERRVMRQVARELAKEYHLEVAEVQAAIWYAEQQAWKAQGAAAESDSFSEPSKTYAKSKGLNPFDVPEGEGGAAATVPGDSSQVDSGGTDARPPAASRQLAEAWSHLPSIETQPGEINAAWQQENQRLKALRNQWEKEDKARNEQLAKDKANENARKAAEKIAAADIASVSKAQNKVNSLQASIDARLAKKQTPKVASEVEELRARKAEAEAILQAAQDKASQSMHVVESQSYKLFERGDNGEVLGSYQRLDPATGHQLISIMQNGDATTVVHELAHWFRDRVLSAEDRAKVDKALGVKDGVWDRDTEERFADMFTQYVKGGKAASPALQSPLEKANAWFGRVADFIHENPDSIPHDVATTFDSLLPNRGTNTSNFKNLAPGTIVETGKGQDITREFNQANALGRNEDYAKLTNTVKNWDKVTAKQLLEQVRTVNGLRTGSKVVDEFGKLRDLKNLEDLGTFGKVAKGPSALGDWMSETMLNNVGRLFRDPAGNLIKAGLTGYTGLNSKARIRQLNQLGMTMPDLSGTVSKDLQSKHSGALYQGAKFVAQWPGMIVGKAILNPLSKAGVKGVGHDINTTVGHLETGTKEGIYTKEAIRGYYVELDKARRDVINEAMNAPAIRRLVEQNIMTKEQVADVVTGKLSFGDIRKMIEYEYHLQNYSPEVNKAADLLDPTVNPHSYVKDAFDNLPPDTKPTDPAFVSRETNLKQTVDDATWTVIDAENDALKQQGGDPAFANIVKYPDYLNAALDNWQAGEEAHFDAQYGQGAKPRPRTIYQKIMGAKLQSIGNPNTRLNSTNQLRTLGQKFLTASPAERVVLIDHFQRADAALRRESGNQYKIDFGTMEPVNIKTGRYLSNELGYNDMPPIEPEGKQLVDPAERQRLIKVSEDLYGPGSTAVADMHQTMTEIRARLGDLADKGWAQMNPAEQDLAASIISRQLGYPDPTSARQAYGLAMEQRQAAYDFMDKLKADASQRSAANGTLSNNLPGLSDPDVNLALDWLRNNKEQATIRAQVAGEQRGKAKVDQMYFDYLDKNRVDQALSNWVPFQYWGRKNIGFLFRHMTENPAHFAALLTFYNAMVSENERLGIPQYARAYLKLWQNGDGSYTMLNFSNLNPFNFGDSDIPLVTVKPDDRLAPESAKTYNQMSLFELALGKDMVSSSGDYYRRELGGVSQFFRINPLFAEFTRVGLWDKALDSIGVQKMLGQAGELNQNHFGDDTTQGLGIVNSRNITRDVAASTGLVGWVRDILRPMGIDMTDLDLEGLPNEVMGRLRNAIENMNDEDYAKIYGKPKTKFDHELMLRVEQGKLSKDEAYSLMAQFRQGKLGLDGLKIYDSILAEDTPRLALSMLGLSTLTVNTPRDMLVQKVIDAYSKVKGDNGSYKIVDGKQVFEPGKTQEFFGTPTGQAASVLFSAGDSSKELTQQVADDKTREAVNKLYAGIKDISTTEFYKQMDALRNENPTYFKNEMEANQKKAGSLVMRKDGELPPRPDEVSIEGYDKKKAFDLLSEQYRNLGGDRMNTLYDLNKVSLGNSGDKAYNDIYAAQTAFIKAHPDWYKEYQANIENKPKDPIVLKPGESYKTDVKDLSDRELTQLKTQYYGIGGSLYDQKFTEAKRLEDKGDKAGANAIYNSQYMKDVEAAQAAFKKDHPDLAVVLDQEYLAKNPGKSIQTDADRMYFDQLEQYKKTGGETYDKLAKKAFDLKQAGDTKGASAIYNSTDYKNGSIARDQFMRNNPDFEKKYADFLASKGETYTPPSKEEQEYFDQLNIFQNIGGDAYDAKAKAVSDAYARGDKVLGAKLYKDQQYQDWKTAREVFLKDHPVFAAKYEQYNKDKYGTPTTADKASTSNGPSYSTSSYSGGNRSGSSYPATSGRAKTTATKVSSGSATQKSSALPKPAKVSWDGVKALTSDYFKGTGLGPKGSSLVKPSKLPAPSGSVAPAPTANPKAMLTQAKNSQVKLPSLTVLDAAKHNWTVRSNYADNLDAAMQEAMTRVRSEQDVLSIPVYQSGTGYILVSKVRGELAKTDLTIVNKALAALQPYYPDYVQYIVNSLAKQSNTVYNQKQPSSVGSTHLPVPTHL